MMIIKKLILLLLFSIGCMVYAQTILPPKLKPGDVIAIIASASNITNMDEIPAIKQRFESMGFRVILGKHIYSQTPLPLGAKKLSTSNPNVKDDLDHAYIQYAGTDAERAADLMDMFKKPNSKSNY